MKTLTTALMITLLTFGSAFADQIQDYDRYISLDWATTQSEEVVSTSLEEMAPTAAGRPAEEEREHFNLNGPFDMQD